MLMFSPMIAGLALLSVPAHAQDAERRQSPVKLYGFINSHFEKAGEQPVGVDEEGDTIFEKSPHEFDVLNFNIMGQGSIARSYRWFFNLAAPGSGSPSEDAPIELRNAWVEMPLAGELLELRMGKTYRRFGLYNERLDATPNYIGIEPPEMFDKDHLLLTRTTNLMLHGKVFVGDSLLSYSLMTGMDERAEAEVPIGADLNLIINGTVTLGSSFYTTNGDAVASHGVGEGPPIGGVATWMEKDSYQVFGGYAQLQPGRLLVQAEYWVAPHHGTRDPEQLSQLAGAGLNGRQLETFGFDPVEPSLTAPEDLRTEADYTVKTGYIRIGHAFYRRGEKRGLYQEFTPYFQVDQYSNPETIAEKDLGGDAEAGIADDGDFLKLTAGLLFRPTPGVALKFDSSGHLQTVNNAAVFYPEIRVNFSYYWEIEQASK
jgi:hypothetical protein